MAGFNSDRKKLNFGKITVTTLQPFFKPKKKLKHAKIDSYRWCFQNLCLYKVFGVYFNIIKTTFLFLTSFFSNYELTSKQGEAVHWLILIVLKLGRNQNLNRKSSSLYIYIRRRLWCRNKFNLENIYGFFHDCLNLIYTWLLNLTYKIHRICTVKY